MATISDKDRRFAQDLATAVSMEVRDRGARDRLLAGMTDTALEHGEERTAYVLALTHSVMETQGELH